MQFLPKFRNRVAFLIGTLGFELKSAPVGTSGGQYTFVRSLQSPVRESATPCAEVRQLQAEVGMQSKELQALRAELQQSMAQNVHSNAKQLELQNALQLLQKEFYQSRSERPAHSCISIDEGFQRDPAGSGLLLQTRLRHALRGLVACGLVLELCEEYFTFAWAGPGARKCLDRIAENSDEPESKQRRYSKPWSAHGARYQKALQDTHTYIHTCIHTYIRIYIHRYIHT